MDKGNIGKGGQVTVPPLQGLPCLPGKEEEVHADRLDGQDIGNRDRYKQNFLGVIV